MKTGKRARALALELAHVETGSILEGSAAALSSKMECILCLAGGVAAANCHCVPWWTTAAGSSAEHVRLELELEGRHQLLRN